MRCTTLIIQKVFLHANNDKFYGRKSCTVTIPKTRKCIDKNIKENKADYLI